MPTIFDWLAVRWPGYVMAGQLGRRPVPDCSPPSAALLDPETAVVADCEPEECRGLFREWPDRDTSEQLAEAVHQLELERAAQPPVIEVTVTTPPGGIPRLELEQAVAEKVAEIAGPPSQPRRMLVATRRAGRRFNDLRQDTAPLPAWPDDESWWPAPDPGLAPPASEDDTPTVELTVRRDDPPEVVEVQVP